MHLDTNHERTMRVGLTTCALVATALALVSVYAREYVLYQSALNAYRAMCLEYYRDNKPDTCNDMSFSSISNLFLSPMSASLNKRKVHAPHAPSASWGQATWNSLFLVDQAHYDDAWTVPSDDDVINSCNHYYMVVNSTSYTVASHIDVLSVVALKVSTGINNVVVHAVDPFVEKVLVPLMHVVNYLSFVKTILVCIVTKYIGYIVYNVRKLYDSVVLSFFARRDDEGEGTLDVCVNAEGHVIF